MLEGMSAPDAGAVVPRRFLNDSTVFRWENLHVNDASMLPDSPGVNPQGTVMALARRNALRFKDTAS